MSKKGVNKKAISVKKKSVKKPIKAKKAKKGAVQSLDMKQLQMQIDIDLINNQQLQDIDIFSPQPDLKRKRGRPRIIRDDDMQQIYTAINRAQTQKKTSTITIQKLQMFQVANNIIKDSGVNFQVSHLKNGHTSIVISPNNIAYGNPTDIIDQHIDSWDLWDYV